MGKKSKKNNKNKKGKESDGRCSITGGRNNNINNNHNHNNNISIPTVVDETVVARTTTTTRTVLTQQDREYVENKLKLKGYPLSNYFVVGYKYYKEKQDDLATASFIHGAENDSCIGCMVLYIRQQYKLNNIHLVVPWALECSIRGHTLSMAVLLNKCNAMSKPITAPALLSFWVKLRIDLGAMSTTEEERKECKKKIANICCVCEKEDSNGKTFEKCGICKYYSYCGKKCQTYHWKELKHMNECRQVILLRKYCKPQYVKEIREAIIGGQDPKEIHTLQRLRMKIGLNRPKEEYEELLLRLGDDNDSTIQDRYHYLTARKDGTVHIGSTTNVI